MLGFRANCQTQALMKQMDVTHYGVDEPGRD